MNVTTRCWSFVFVAVCDCSLSGGFDESARGIRVSCSFFVFQFCHARVVLEHMYFSWFTFFVTHVVESLDTKRVAVLTCERLF